MDTKFAKESSKDERIKRWQTKAKNHPDYQQIGEEFKILQKLLNLLVNK